MQLCQANHVIVLEESTCSAEDALSPALVPEPLELLHNVLDNWQASNCAIQESFHLHAHANSLAYQAWSI